MYLDPLYLLVWIGMDVLTPSGQIYVILSILCVVDLVKGFDD